jgi:hypothetical protein
MLDSTFFVYTNVGATFSKNVGSTFYEKILIQHFL